MAESGLFTFHGENAAKIAFPLGGIGTGSISLSGSGRLKDWEIFNRPNKNSVNGFTHFAVRAERDGKVVDARILNGPFQGEKSGDYTGLAFRSFGFGARREYLAGMPHFADCRFRAAFPFATLDFKDDSFPGTARLTAFNPFIPMNEKDSGVPAAFFEIEIANDQTVRLDYTVVGVMQNPVEVSGVVEPLAIEGVQGVVMSSRMEKADSIDYGTYAIATDSSDTSVQRHWYRGNWFDSLEVYWNDMLRGGRFADRHYDEDSMQNDHSLVASHFSLEPGETRRVRYLIAWHVPNCRKYWLSNNGLLSEPKELPEQWRNYYAVLWPDCRRVTEYAFTNWDGMRGASRNFADAIHASSLPEPVLDAVISNLAVLKTATVLRLEDGTFYGWEGCHPDAGSCEGTCDHVWNYQMALPFLFPSLERSIRDDAFATNQNAASGGMAFRKQLPSGIGVSDDRPCADGQFGVVLKTYREWKISGDDAWLAGLWPRVKAALEYAWHPANPDKWDPDKTGVLWGRQHHTLDMELFGPSGWLCGMYLAGLLAGAAMADRVGDREAAAEYRAIYEHGRAWVNDNLFNGEYFIQKIDLGDHAILDRFAHGPRSSIVSGSIEEMYWSEEHGELKYQIGEGSSIDQVLGHYFTAILGLEPVFDREKLESALLAIYRHNYKNRLGDMYNPCRVFGMENESGTIICAYPAGVKKPVIPAPYSQETMHGFEYAFGVELMQCGFLDKGVRVFNAVRSRYNGSNRNPWNEMECGSHYARSMASYAALPVLSGFSFNLPDKTISFRPLVRHGSSFRCFWSVGRAWGEMALEDGLFLFKVTYGSISLDRLGLPLSEPGTVRLAGPGVSGAERMVGADGMVDLTGMQLSAGDTVAFASPGLKVSHLPDIADLGV